MTAEEQLYRWVDGESVHNLRDDTCCPDFSCCIEGIDTSYAERERFKQAYENQEINVMNEMLETYLARSFLAQDLPIFNLSNPGRRH